MATVARFVATACCLVAVWSSNVATAATDERKKQLQDRIGILEAKIAAQSEARDRQADAFDAATNRIEIVSGALVALLALGGIGAGLLALRWVRSYTEGHVEKRIEETLQASGKDYFEREASALRDEYEPQFTNLYRRYKRLVDEE